MKNLASLKSASLLYQTHFLTKLDNPYDNLQNELHMKQKGLDKKVKQMMKTCDFHSIVVYMNSLSSTSSDSYKQIKKCVKEKIKLLFEQFIRTLSKNTFTDQLVINKKKEELILIESA